MYTLPFTKWIFDQMAVEASRKVISEQLKDGTNYRKLETRDFKERYKRGETIAANIISKLNGAFKYLNNLNNLTNWVRHKIHESERHMNQSQ